MGGGFEGSVNLFIPSNLSCLSGSIRKRAPNALLSKTQGSIILRCKLPYLFRVIYGSQHAIDRTNVQRNFRIEDANSIVTHLPFIGARIASPRTTAEEIVEIAREVWSHTILVIQWLTRIRSRKRRVGGKIRTART